MITSAVVDDGSELLVGASNHVVPDGEELATGRHTCVTTGVDEVPQDTGSALERFGIALRDFQDVATATGAPEVALVSATHSLHDITEQLRPFVAELGTDQDFERYVATSGSHTLNPALEVVRKGEGFIEMSVRFGPFFRNAFGYVNGGAIASMFDTAIAHVAFEYAGRSFTANLNVDYRNFAPLDVELLVKVRLESVEGRKHIVVAELFNGDVLVSEAHALLLQAKD